MWEEKAFSNVMNVGFMLQWLLVPFRIQWVGIIVGILHIFTALFDKHPVAVTLCKIKELRKYQIQSWEGHESYKVIKYCDKD